MRFIPFFVMVLLSVTSFAWAQTDGSTEEPVDATITVDNVEARAFLLVNAEGEDVGSVGTKNAVWTLQVGHRYRIVNGGELLFHPFELRSDADILLAQGDTLGTFEGDSDVDFIGDAAGVTFTLTPELTAQLGHYRCAYHPVITGEVKSGGAP